MRFIKRFIKKFIKRFIKKFIKNPAFPGSGSGKNFPGNREIGKSGNRRILKFQIFPYCAYHINRDNSRRVLYSDEIRKVFFTTFVRDVSRDQTRFLRRFYDVRARRLARPNAKKTEKTLKKWKKIEIFST